MSVIRVVFVTTLAHTTFSLCLYSLVLVSQSNLGKVRGTQARIPAATQLIPQSPNLGPG